MPAQGLATPRDIFWLEAEVDAFVLAMKIRDDVPTVLGTVDAPNCGHAGTRNKLAWVTEERVQRFIRPNDSGVSETFCVELEVSYRASLSIEDVLQLRTSSITAYGVTSDAVGSKLNFTARQLRRRRSMRVQQGKRECEKKSLFHNSPPSWATPNVHGNRSPRPAKPRRGRSG